MKSGCIRHPEKEPLIEIHRWQVEICDGDVTAALIVGYFHLIEIGRLPRPKFIDTTKVVQGLLDSWHKSTVTQALKHLTELSLVTEYRLTMDEATKMCKAKIPQSFQNGDLYCQWCNSVTVILQQHHYPIPKSEQGKLTVDICASCHAEFHYLVSTSFYTPSTLLLKEFVLHPLTLEEVA